jgi:hypothetical protein
MRTSSLNLFLVLRRYGPILPNYCRIHHQLNDQSLKGHTKETRLVGWSNGSGNKDYGTAPTPIVESIYHNHHI